MKRIFAGIATAALFITALVAGAPPASAGGSDAPTPYLVTVEGVTLLDGETFQENEHVNWRTSWEEHGVHFVPNNGHPGAVYIGQSFIPFNLEPGECVIWVQVSKYNEHFGEGGQEPVCKPNADEPPVVDEPTETPTEAPEVCEEGFTPGWLDEDGNAQGCVSNGSPESPESEVVSPEKPRSDIDTTTPNVVQEVVPVVAPIVADSNAPAPVIAVAEETLPVTGSDPLSTLALAGGAIFLGAGAMLIARRRASNS